MALSGIAVVTGGAGFIGSHIAGALAASGARVRIIDDLSTGHSENLDEIGGDVDFIQGSVADQQLLAKALENVESDLSRSGDSFRAALCRSAAKHARASVDGTFSLLVGGERCRVRRVVMRPSSSAYGDQTDVAKGGTDGARSAVAVRGGEAGW
jgi:UDP-glucose 4-epimerase